MEPIELVAQDHMRALAKQNMRTRFLDNPCRGLVLGMDYDGNQVQLCWIMGRSENSQNRVYVVEGDTVRTAPADPAKVKDPKLIIYNAMRVYGNTWTETDGRGTRVHQKKNAHIVGNGDQVDSVWRAFDKNNDPDHNVFHSIIQRRGCEPDPPNFTPRITGYTDICRDHWANISIIRADPIAKKHWLLALEEATAKGLRREDFAKQEEFYEQVDAVANLDHHLPSFRATFGLQLHRGLGYCVTTYKPGSKELPSFEGEPFIVPVLGSLDETIQCFWEHLEKDWRVAIAGKKVSSIYDYQVKVINRHEIAA